MEKGCPGRTRVDTSARAGLWQAPVAAGALERPVTATGSSTAGLRGPAHVCPPRGGRWRLSGSFLSPRGRLRTHFSRSRAFL